MGLLVEVEDMFDDTDEMLLPDYERLVRKLNAQFGGEKRIIITFGNGVPVLGTE